MFNVFEFYNFSWKFRLFLAVILLVFSDLNAYSTAFINFNNNSSVNDTSTNKNKSKGKSSDAIQNFTALVNPFVGTGGHGHTFPGAVYPFGMMQLSPDTRLDGWDGCSGYHYSDSLIYGFSHTHLSGTGVPDYCDVLFMPGTGTANLNIAAEDKQAFASSFRKESEKASPGYYSVLLDKHKIQAEFTVGKRTGIHHYTFKNKSDQWLLIDLKHRDKLLKAGFTNVGLNFIEGNRVSIGWARQQYVYFKSVFSKNIKSIQYSADSLKAIIYFVENSSKDLYAHVAISAVDALGASKNLEGEYNQFNFNKMHSETKAQWNKMLGRMQVLDPDSKGKRIFYTALYHNLIHPSLFQDVDNRYRGMDLNIHSTQAEDHFTVFSLWDTYRSTHPLYQWIYPEYNSKFIRTFLRHYQECGHLPVWELAANETWCMIGNHSIPVIANSFHHRVFDFDTSLAKEAIQNTILNGNNTGIKFMTKGFILSNEESESVSKTIENSLDFAAAASIHCKGLEKYSPDSYKNLYNPESGYYQARWNNQFIQPFDPLEVNHHYTEANAYQYLFGAHHDVEGMKSLFLLSDKETNKEMVLIKRLDDLFYNKAEMTGRVQPDITGLIGQYAHGNEPSHHLAYLYNDANAPEKTQILIKKIKNEFYNDTPEGLIGNEDCGQMSSWFIFSALGFYPLNPFNATYTIGFPSFKNVKIQIPNQKPILIKSTAALKPEFVSSFSINGRATTNYFKLKAGDHLHFQLDAKSYKINREQQKNSETNYLVRPYVSLGNRVFKDSTIVRLASLYNNPIEYCFDTTTNRRFKFLNDLVFKTETRLYFRNQSTQENAEWLYADFIRKPQGMQLKLQTSYANQYPASGNDALIDGLQGSMDFRDGLWQGYQGKDIQLLLEFSEERDLNYLGIRFLQDQGPWILMPTQVEFKISEDGKHFESLDLIRNQISQKEEGAIVHEFNTNQKFRCRFVQIKAKNAGPLPDWHQGAGGASWLFTDEIVIK